LGKIFLRGDALFPAAMKIRRRSMASTRPEQMT